MISGAIVFLSWIITNKEAPESKLGVGFPNN
jgi:hypothetical protein